MNYRFISIAVLSMIGVVLMGYVVQTTSAESSGSETDRSTEIASPATTSLQTVELYYYRPQDDMDVKGDLQCSSAGLAAVPYKVERSSAVIRDTVEILLTRELQQAQQQNGVISEFPVSGLKLIGVRIENGLATVALDDTKDEITAGTCRAAVLQSQITATVQQFPSVAEVRFVPETLFGM
ncbi:MAG: GerMN domain-containing protein [Candidatus Paceibacterota bacterium]